MNTTDYIAQLQAAVLAAECILADVATARRKGYTPKPIYAAADLVRSRRTKPAEAPADPRGEA